MQQSFPRYPGSREELRAENDMMKKTLMEKGAEFGKSRFLSTDDGDEIENIILKQVLEYERLAATAKKIKIYEKIEKPTHFRPAASIPDHEINQALEDLISYLHKYSLDVDVCNPSVTNRELYRFTVEELFYYDIEDVQVDGLITCYVYDEFHPDPVFDNTVAAVDFCMKCILDKAPMNWMHRFRKGNLRLNQHRELTVDEVREKINNYKMSYDDLKIRKLQKHQCVISEDKCVVKGEYSVSATEDKEMYHLYGSWKVYFEPSSQSKHWNIVGVEVEGIKF
jgi:hypothetical protein